MSLSTIDFISPKITLYYNGRKSHVSNIGGFFSVCLLVAIILFIFYIIWDVLVDPKIISSLIYEHYLNKKIVQPLNYKGINHFIQLYSQKDDEWLENYDKKSIIIYSIKGNQTISRENPQNNLDNIEHWLYDKCEKIYDKFSILLIFFQLYRFFKLDNLNGFNHKLVNFGASAILINQIVPKVSNRFNIIENSENTNVF